jgi:hypothetical protein
MKSICSLLCAPRFVLSVFCSPLGSSCPSKSHPLAGQQCKAWVKPKETVGKKGLSSRKPERFDPFRVGKLGCDAIRGWRAQKACPCPRLLVSIPSVRCHLRDMGVGRCSHSRESGNLSGKPSEMRGRRTGFPPFGKPRASFSRK